MTNLELEDLMWQALRSPCGIVVRCSDADAVRRRFYPIRKANLAFTPLAASVAPNGEANELFIVNKGTPNGPPEE